MKKGLLIVISGPAGGGKGTVTAKLFETGAFVSSVSATTREIRPGETDGVNYYYISKEEFFERVEKGDMLEYNLFCNGQYYGTPRKEVERVLNEGRNIILEIDVNGGMNVKAHYPDALLIMLLAPTYAIQEERLRGRGTEKEEDILARLKQAKEEVVRYREYDYVVFNPDGCPEKAAADILAIVCAEQLALAGNTEGTTESDRAAITRAGELSVSFNPRVADCYFEGSDLN